MNVDFKMLTAFLAAITGVNFITYHFLWWLYGYAKFYESTSSPAYQQLVIACLATIYLTTTITYLKLSKTKPPAPTQETTEPQQPKETKEEKLHRENYERLQRELTLQEQGLTNYIDGPLDAHIPEPIKPQKQAKTLEANPDFESTITEAAKNKIIDIL
ncbi:MAG: hypothetical protein WC325_12065, partial [Candidatus Bathyarchaeia archaeon]